MGLDMYLTKSTYVKNWDHFPDKEKWDITIKRGGAIQRDIKPFRITTVIEEVAYWRKANQIHRWFVENVQEGKDDCGEYIVSKQQLKALLTVCNQVLNTVETVDGPVNTGKSIGPGETEWTRHTKPGKVVAQKELAAQMLPNQSGFFFGSTDYDEFYLDDLRRTVEQLTPLMDESCEYYYYHASW